MKQTGFVLLAPISMLFDSEHIAVCRVNRGHRNWFDVLSQHAQRAAATRPTT